MLDSRIKSVPPILVLISVSVAIPEIETGTVHIGGNLTRRSGLSRISARGFCIERRAACNMNKDVDHRTKLAHVGIIYYQQQRVVLDQISLVRKVYRKYRKQTLPLGYLDHIMALNRRRHDFTKDPGGPQKHCVL